MTRLRRYGTRLRSSPITYARPPHAQSRALHVHHNPTSESTQAALARMSVVRPAYERALRDAMRDEPYAEPDAPEMLAIAAACQ